AVILVACTASNWDVHQDWLTYHVLMLGFVVLGGVMLAIGWLEARRRLRAAHGDVVPGEPFLSENVVEGWLTSVAIPVLLLVWRAAFHDPTGAAWSAGCVVILSLFGSLLALWQRRQRWAFLSGLGFNIAVSLWLGRYHRDLGDSFTAWWPDLLR